MKLFRISNFVFLGIAATFGVLLFWTSQAVQSKEDALADAKANLAQETEALRVLTVEWDYLNRPQRLEELARTQLGMLPPSAKEVVRTAQDIPEPLFLEEEGLIQTVSVQVPAVASPSPANPVVAPILASVVISPSRAEKQSFDQLIQSLDDSGAR